MLRALGRLRGSSGFRTEGFRLAGAVSYVSFLLVGSAGRLRSEGSIVLGCSLSPWVSVSPPRPPFGFSGGIDRFVTMWEMLMEKNFSSCYI